MEMLRCVVCRGKGEYWEAGGYLGDEEIWIMKKCEHCEGKGWINTGDDVGGEE